MTVLKTSMRNFFAHKGRMALSAVAVLLSVAFVCGTLVFTDTMNTTFDKLFASTASDVTLSAKAASVDEVPGAGRPEGLPASLVDRVRRAEGVREATGSVVSVSVTVVDAKNKNLGPTSGAPTIAVSWNQNELRSVGLTSGRLPSGSSSGRYIATMPRAPADSAKHTCASSARGSAKRSAAGRSTAVMSPG